MSSELCWFSTCLRFVVLIESDEEEGNFEDVVVVFRALDWEEARTRALSLGRAREQSYRNGVGSRVVRRLQEIRTLDQLGSELGDAREVYWQPAAFVAGEAFAFQETFNPELTSPDPSGV
jgi:Domain of unknown function (DUF4288)